MATEYARNVGRETNRSMMKPYVLLCTKGWNCIPYEEGSMDEDDWIVMPEIVAVIMRCPHCMTEIINEKGDNADEVAKEKALKLLTLSDEGYVTKGTTCPKCGKEITNFCMEHVYAKESVN